MNILHLKYAVQIADTGSISRAAELLYTAQPNVSRAIRELETDLGITVFERSSHGMSLTPEGEQFIGYARKVLRQIDEIEELYKNTDNRSVRFSVCVPPSDNISDRFAEFVSSPDNNCTEIMFAEQNAVQTIRAVASGEYRLGIIRYHTELEKYYNGMLEQKGLSCEKLSEFGYKLIVSRDSELAGTENITYSDLLSFREVRDDMGIYPTAAYLFSENRHGRSEMKKVIQISSRSTIFRLIGRDTGSFCFSEPLTEEFLEMHGLVQLDMKENTRVFRDVFIRRSDYQMTEQDKRFLSILKSSM